MQFLGLHPRLADSETLGGHPAIFNQPYMDPKAHSSLRTTALKESGFILSAVSLLATLSAQEVLPRHPWSPGPAQEDAVGAPFFSGWVGQSQSAQHMSTQGNDETNCLLTVCLTSHLP